MKEHQYPAASGLISVLFHPNAVPIVDIFRSISRLEDHYDLALLNGPEQALTSYTRPEAAKAIISDALLFAFALTRQRSQPLCHKPLKSRHASMDEYCLLALIGSSREPGSELTFEAATALGVSSMDFMASLASDLVRQIDLASLAFHSPNASEFRAIIGDQILFDDLDAPLERSEIKFRF
jgi:hypothetical protein